jgi:hypothetical protein
MAERWRNLIVTILLVVLVAGTGEWATSRVLKQFTPGKD